MNGQSTVNPSTNSNEQLIGKFHVVNVDKLPINPVNSHEETTVAATAAAPGAAVPAAQAPPPPSSAAADESACASRFQMIRVDRNFARGRWKVNDYEPPENTSTSINPPVNTIENDPVNISSSTTLASAPITTAAAALPNNAPPGLPVDSIATSSVTLAATAASAAAAAATAFQQQQRLVLNNPAANVMPPANVPPPAGLLHAYPPGTLPNIAAGNQPYLLPNHQFGYYPFFPSHYTPYPHQWAHLPPTNHYLPHPHPHQQQQATQPLPGNLGDGIRYGDTVVDVPNENPVISSTQFSNPATDHLQNAQMAVSAAGPFLYPAHHPYVQQPPPANASPYATIASYHPTPSLSTIIPPHQQPLSLAQPPPTSAADLSLTSQQPQLHQAPPAQQPQQQQQQQPAPILTSPKHDASSTKTSVQPAAAPKPAVASVPTNLPKPLTTVANGSNNDALRAIPNPTQITDLLSSSPSMSGSQPPPSLLSPITVQTNNSAKTPTASLNDIWSYATGGSPLNVPRTVAQTAAATAAAAMDLLSNESAKNEITNEILKELTTPTKQNNTADIDNKISAAMDLVKMHLLSAVREEVTELRQQIRILNEKVTSVEHENAFLRQHVPSEIYAQYTPLFVGTSTANDSSNSTTNATATATTAPPVPLSSSQPIPSAAAASLPSSIAQQASASTTSQVPTLPPPPASINLPPT